MGLQVIRFSELYKEFLVPFSFVENYFTPNQFDRFYMVNMSEEESVSPNRRDKGGASSEHIFSPLSVDVKLCYLSSCSVKMMLNVTCYRRPN